MIDQDPGHTPTCSALMLVLLNTHAVRAGRFCSTSMVSQMLMSIYCLLLCERNDRRGCSVEAAGITSVDEHQVIVHACMWEVNAPYQLMHLLCPSQQNLQPCQRNCKLDLSHCQSVYD